MNFTFETDAELLARCLASDSEFRQAAFDQLVRRHGPMVYRICARCCRTRHDAEDATQAVFVTLANRAGELRGRTSLAGWLHRTAAHVALRQRRGALTRRRHERLAGTLRPENSGGGAGLAPQEPDGEDLDRLHRALSALPEDYRNALILHHLEGHTVEQVAALLATRPGTVAARLSRGRAMLRQRLGVMGAAFAAGVIEELLTAPAAEARQMSPDLALAINRSTMGLTGTTGTVGSAAGKVPTAAAGALAMTAAPLSLAGQLKAAALIIGLSLSSLTAAGAVAYRTWGPTAAPTTPTQAANVSPRQPESPPRPIGIPHEWSAGASSVPEPAALIAVAPIALLLRRRPRQVSA